MPPGSFFGLTVLDVQQMALERAMRAYVDSLGLAWPDVIKRTTRLIMRDINSITPPKSNIQGRKAVERDINRAIFLIDPDKITSASRLKAAVIARDYTAVQSILRNMKKGHWSSMQVVPFRSSYHTQVRDKRGRVQHPKGIATLDVSEHRKYVKATQGHVGFTRSGWADGSAIAGLKVPRWVARHSSRPGRIVDKMNLPDRPTLTIIHEGTMTATAIDEGKIEKLLDRRIASMERDVRQVLAGRASRYFP